MEHGRAESLEERLIRSVVDPSKPDDVSIVGGVRIETPEKARAIVEASRYAVDHDVASGYVERVMAEQFGSG